MSEDHLASDSYPLPDTNNEIVSPPLSDTNNGHVESPFLSVSHQYYDEEKKDHIKKDFSLLFHL